MGNLEPSLAKISGSASRATRVRYLVLAGGCGMALLAYLHRIGFAVLAPEIKEDFALSDQDMGYLMSVFLVCYGVGQIPCGLAGDRLGARLLLTLFVLGSSLATVVIALVPAATDAVWQPLFILLAVRAVFGLCQSGAFPVFARVVADWMPLTERASAQGAMWTSSRLGAALTPFLLTWLLTLYGWRAPLGMLGALGLLWCAAFWSWFRNRPEQVAQVNEAERALIQAGQPAGPERPSAIPWRQMLGSRSVWCLCLMYGCCGPAGNFFSITRLVVGIAVGCSSGSG